MLSWVWREATCPSPETSCWPKVCHNLPCHHNNTSHQWRHVGCRLYFLHSPPSFLSLCPIKPRAPITLFHHLLQGTHSAMLVHDPHRWTNEPDHRCNPNLVFQKNRYFRAMTTDTPWVCTRGRRWELEGSTTLVMTSRQLRHWGEGHSRQACTHTHTHSNAATTSVPSTGTQAFTHTRSSSVQGAIEIQLKGVAALETYMQS